MKEYRLPGDNTSKSLALLSQLMNTIPDQLHQLSEVDFSLKPAPGKWSPKEVIGHLIDSATNNHHRFIRAQFENKPHISYQQESWNEAGHYAEMDGHRLIDFWRMYNRFLVELISRLPKEMISRECLMSDGNGYSIGWLFDDYVRHLEHHLRQIGIIHYHKSDI